MPSRNIIAWNSLLAGFAAAHDGDGALKLFRGMELEGPEPSPVSWTSLISAHAREGKHAFVFGLFQEMVSRRSRPTPETLAVVLSVSTEMRLLHEGKALHLIVVRDGLELYVFVRNSLISLYGMLGDTEKEAELIFSETKPKNLVTWNCIISCHAARLRHEKSLQLFMEMQETAGLKPNTVTWSAVIGGLASGGRFSQALEMFRRMQELSVRHNSVTLVTVISSCAELSALWLGKEVHGHTLRTSFAANSGPNLVENGLISMYAKCGSLKDARRVFDGLSTRRDIVSWNAMISSYGISGLGGEALALFKEMVVAGIEPDGISYVAVLSACAHAGLVAEGKQLFRRVKRPGVEHYACLVDLLGRAGLLDEARSMIEQMVMEPNVYVWGALLNACRMHGNEVMAEEVGNRMLSLGAEIAGSCSLLANVYAACGRWDDSGQVRMMMRNKELRKSPGQSWIEVGKAVYVFTSGAPLKPEMEVVYQVLDELSQLMERWE
ncbi:pentatricopeptide repeat (PPR-like) superfamily protein [Wolffia australiana]